MSPCSQGYLCLYSLKNPSYPENVIKTNSGVMCVDIHAEKPHFIALGLASGNLMVYNMQLSTTEPQYENSLVATQHSNIIWDVSVFKKFSLTHIVNSIDKAISSRHCLVDKCTFTFLSSHQFV